MYAYLCMYIYVCIHVCMNVCMHVCIHTYTYYTVFLSLCSFIPLEKTPADVPEICNSLTRDTGTKL